MKEILLQYFQVKLDENGKELEEPIGYGLGEYYPFKYKTKEEYEKAVLKYNYAQTVIKLPTRTEFDNKCVEYWKPTNLCLLSCLDDILSYKNIVNKPLTLKQFIGEDAIFIEHIHKFKKSTFNIDLILMQYSTTEQAINNGVTLYINPDKI